MASPNMNLPIPSVSNTGGPLWATDLNGCMTLIDQHDHSPGNGVPVTPDGLSISSDLTFLSNNATNVRSIRFTAQVSPLGAPLDLGCLYESGVDLYFNDGNGNQIQITSGGGVAGSPGSIGSLTSPASATYNAGSTKFVWNSDTSKFAAMENGAVIIHETNVAATNSITLQSPSALAASYTLQFPAALPGSTQYLTSTSGGTMSFSSADAIGQAMGATGANAVAASRTRATGTTVSAGGVAISNSSGNYSTTSNSPVDITNLSVTITTSGRPVRIECVSDGSTNPSFFQAFHSSSNSSNATINVVRGSTEVGTLRFGSQSVGSTTSGDSVPPGAISHIDAVSAGTYTYKLQGSTTSASTSLFVQYIKLVAYEL